MVMLANCAVAIAAPAEVLTRCAGSRGYSYYFPNQLAPREKTGWGTDGILRNKTFPLTLTMNRGFIRTGITPIVDR